jgi:hypothetical protein
MADLRTLVAQGRKRIGFLLGAGAAAAMKNAAGSGPLIPALSDLTKDVLGKVDPKFAKAIAAFQKRTPDANIEKILSWARALAGVLGVSQVEGLSGDDYGSLSQSICAEIGKVVNVNLPSGENPYRHLVSWAVGADRDHPVEVFTTNYDLLLEEAFAEVKAAYFDGFAGSRDAFFDPVTVASNDLPPRWARIWKLHGSLGWKSNGGGEVIRTGEPTSTHLIFPEHLKYDQTQKAPYTALFDRLRSFLTTKDTLLIASGFSFRDAHVSARIDESLAANPSASVFAFQYGKLAENAPAREMARTRPNFSVYAADKAVVAGVDGDWKPGDPPTKDWDAIRATYWEGGAFTLGDFAALMRFLALSRTQQYAAPAVPAGAP